MFTVQDAVIVGATYVAANVANKLIGPTADKAGEWVAGFVPLDAPAKLKSYAEQAGKTQFKVDAVAKKAEAIAEINASSSGVEEEDDGSVVQKNKGGRPKKQSLEPATA